MEASFHFLMLFCEVGGYIDFKWGLIGHIPLLLFRGINMWTLKGKALGSYSLSLNLDLPLTSCVISIHYFSNLPFLYLGKCGCHSFHLIRLL